MQFSTAPDFQNILLFVHVQIVLKMLFSLFTDLHLAAESLELVANELINLGNSSTNPQSPTPSAPFSPGKGSDTSTELKGNLHMLVVQAKGKTTTRDSKS